MAEFYISYRLVTEFGTTPSQGRVLVELEADEELEWEPPYVPPEVLEWVPEFESANPKAKKKLPAKKRGQKAKIPTNDPAEIPEDSRPVSGREEEEEESGLDAPTSALSDIAPIGQTLPTPGAYEWRLTKDTVDPDDGTEDETPMGPPAAIVVTTGFYPRIRLPRDYGNWIKNPEVAARKNDAAKSPEDWERPTAAGITSLDDEPGVQDWDDQSESTLDQDLFKTAPISVADKPTITDRAVLEMSDYESGDFDYILRQNLSNATFTETILRTINTAGEHDVVTVLGATGTPGINVAWNALVSTYQMVGRNIGSRT